MAVCVAATAHTEWFDNHFTAAGPSIPAHLPRHIFYEQNRGSGAGLVQQTVQIVASHDLTLFVSFITAFEYYLFEILERLIYIDPSLINDSALAIEAKELALIENNDFHRWLSNKVADKYLRRCK